jgi:hypothetical protein
MLPPLITNSQWAGTPWEEREKLWTSKMVIPRPMQERALEETPTQANRVFWVRPDTKQGADLVINDIKYMRNNGLEYRIPYKIALLTTIPHLHPSLKDYINSLPDNLREIPVLR